MVETPTAALSPEGLITLPSPYTPKETLDRLAATIESHGMTVMARIDHAGAAAKADLDLRPTEVLIFGNPRAGTLLMQASQLIGIDLPLRALAWQDAAQRNWLSYIDPAWLAGRYGIAEVTQGFVAQMASALKAVTAEATA
jgi:uncharacterized protein (DUF302 family)